MGYKNGRVAKSYGRSYYTARNLATAAVREAGKRAIQYAAKKAGEAVVRGVKRRLSGSATTTQPQKKQRYNKRGSYSTASYSGKFTKPTRRGLAKLEATYQRQGVKFEHETSGQVTAVSCGYIGHSSVVPNLCSIAIGTALMKKLIEKAFGRKIINVEEVITPGVTPAGVTNYFILGRDPKSGAVSTFFSAGITSTTTTLGLGQVLKRELDRMLALNVAGQDQVWEPYALTVNENSDVPIARIWLSDVRVHMMCKATLKIQNRSVSADADNEADDINNVPLHGQLYHMKGFIPTYNGEEDSSFFRYDATGVTTANGNAATYSSFKNPPHPKFFRNVEKASKVVLQPGAIRSDYLSSVHHSDLVSVWRRLASTAENTSLTNATNTNMNSRTIMGKQSMVALEKMINFGDKKIDLVYESENKIFTYISIKSGGLCESVNLTSTQSTLAPT